MPIDPGLMDSVTNANFKNLADAPAFYAAQSLKSAVDNQDQVMQIGRASLQMFHQMMSGLGMLHQQQLTANSMTAGTAAAKSAEDMRNMDPKDARGEGLLTDPRTWAGADLSALRSMVRDELQSALVGLAGVREGTRTGG